MNIRAKIYILIISCVLQQCRCNEFENTNTMARHYVELVLVVNDDEVSVNENNSQNFTNAEDLHQGMRGIDFVEDLPKSDIIKTYSNQPWKKAVRIALPRIGYKNINDLGKEISIEKEFTDSKNKSYTIKVICVPTAKLISPSRGSIVQYKIKKISCNEENVEIYNTDWLDESHYEPDAKIYI